MKRARSLPKADRSQLNSQRTRPLTKLLQDAPKIPARKGMPIRPPPHQSADSPPLDTELRDPSESSPRFVHVNVSASSTNATRQAQTAIQNNALSPVSNSKIASKHHPKPEIMSNSCSSSSLYSSRRSDTRASMYSMVPLPPIARCDPHPKVAQNKANKNYQSLKSHKNGGLVTFVGRKFDLGRPCLYGTNPNGKERGHASHSRVELHQIISGICSGAPDICTLC
ncbi:hypothetical protein BC830DRAFT_786074 [Chytriomyces sp. MP71]|nr:hypothetical protein BC830DRAFT_786074 [Chytriomyces sp. MP71]